MRSCIQSWKHRSDATWTSDQSSLEEEDAVANTVRKSRGGEEPDKILLLLFFCFFCDKNYNLDLNISHEGMFGKRKKKK